MCIPVTFRSGRCLFAKFRRNPPEFRPAQPSSELDMADSVHPTDIDTFIDNAAWAIRSTYHTVLKASPGAAIFGRDMLFDIPFVADWKQIVEYRQSQTDRSNTCENYKRVDHDYKVGDKILIRKDGILRKAESIWKKEP